MDKCRDKRCPSGKICNPASGRCVDVNGKIGKTLRKRSPVQRTPSPKRKTPSPKRKSPGGDKCKNVVCSSGKICNPASGRCVDKYGKIGKSLWNKQDKQDKQAPIAVPIPVYAEEKKDIYESEGGKEEKKEFRIRRGNLPDSYKLYPNQTCSMPFTKIDRNNNISSGGNKTYKIYTLEELYRKLQHCGKSAHIYSSRIEGNNMRYHNIVRSLPDKKLVLKLKGEDYLLLLTPQLKGKDFEEYSKLVQKLYDEYDSETKTRENLRQIFIKSDKYPGYAGIMYFLQKGLSHTRNNEVYHQVQYYLEYYEKLYDAMLDYLKKDFPREFSSKVNQAGNPPQYTIKAGTIFYRGVRRFENIDSIRPKFWLAYEKQNSQDYIIPTGKYIRELSKFCDSTGGITVYRLTKDITVPNMENTETVKEIRSRIKDKKLKNIFDIAFNVKGRIVYRKSYMREDALIVDWMCANGILGFTADDFGGSFWSELFLCKPEGIVEYIGYYDLEDLGLDICKPEYMSKKITL